MAQLGANAHGEVLEPGRVPDCYLGLRLDPADDAPAAGVLIVGPAVLLYLVVPQPDGTVLYELMTGHPDRAPGELVFLADLTVELRVWATDTWGQGWRGPGGGLQRSHRPLARRPAQGPPARWADGRGGDSGWSGRP